LTPRGIAAALAAFAGLAIMIGAHPAGLAALGIMAAIGAAICRVAMLHSRGARRHRPAADHLVLARLLHHPVVAFALATWNWQPPAGALGWFGLVGLGVATTVGILAVYVSTVRIGPFRTAMFMNLVPLLTAIGSAMFLGEVLNALQVLGGANMLAALVAFQMRR
jgi:probable blue pigment (indigoidine) exporter